MTFPTQAYLQSLMPAQNATVDPAAFMRRLSSLIPGADVSVDGQTVTVMAERQSVTATLPEGVTFAAPVLAVRNIANANAATTQSGKWPTDATA